MNPYTPKGANPLDTQMLALDNSRNVRFAMRSTFDIDDPWGAGNMD